MTTRPDPLLFVVDALRDLPANPRDVTGPHWHTLAAICEGSHRHAVDHDQRMRQAIANRAAAIHAGQFDPDSTGQGVDDLAELLLEREAIQAADAVLRPYAAAAVAACGHDLEQLEATLPNPQEQ